MRWLSDCTHVWLSARVGAHHVKCACVNVGCAAVFCWILRESWRKQPKTTGLSPGKRSAKKCARAPDGAMRVATLGVQLCALLAAPIAVEAAAWPVVVNTWPFTHATEQAWNVVRARGVC